MNALANPAVGKFINENFVSAFQKVATFRITANGQKQGGNVASYFCAPDGRVLHVVAGPVNSEVLLREAKWVVDTVRQCMETSKGDGAAFKAAFRTAHAQMLRQQFGMVVEPVTFDPPAGHEDSSMLSYRDPTGRPLAPVLPAPPMEGPDVSFPKAAMVAQEARAGMGGVPDRRGRRWALPNEARVHHLLAAHCLAKIEVLYGSVFEGILGEKVSTKPVEVVTPFPWVKPASR